MGVLYKGKGDHSVVNLYPDWVPDIVSAQPSRYFTEHCAQMQLVGKVARQTGMRNKRVDDVDFADFWRTTTGEEPAESFKSYGNAHPNVTGTYRGFGKYQAEPLILEESKAAKLRRAFSWLSSHFYPYMKDSVVLPKQDVVEALDPTTSCGYPWNARYCDKNEFFDSEDAVHVDLHWEAIMGGVRPLTLWSVCAKEELRPTEKLRLGKIRTINGSAIEHSVSTNRMCLDMNRRFLGSQGQTWSAVGMNIYAGGWDTLIQRLQKHGAGWALDESGYDASLIRQLLEGVRDFRWTCIRQSIAPGERAAYKRALWILYEDIIFSIGITPLGELIAKTQGNPSGCVNTTVDNTLILFVLLAYSWITTAPDTHQSYESFMACVEAALYGDDNTFSVDLVARKFFNPSTISAAMLELRVVCTCNHVEARPVTDLDFLSNVSVTYGGVHFPKPVDGMKLVHSAAYRDRKDIPTRLARICGLRQRAFFDAEVFTLLDHFATYLVNKYGVLWGANAEWKAALAMLKSPEAIMVDYQPCYEGETLLSVDTPIKAIMSSKPKAQGPAKSKNQLKRARQRANRKKGVPTRGVDGSYNLVFAGDHNTVELALSQLGVDSESKSEYTLNNVCVSVLGTKAEDIVCVLALPPEAAEPPDILAVRWSVFLKQTGVVKLNTFNDFGATHYVPCDKPFCKLKIVRPGADQAVRTVLRITAGVQLRDRKPHTSDADVWRQAPP